MARRRNSTGFFGTLFASLTGGTSIRRTTTWTGKPKTIVTNHATGKTKTYTGKQGLFGNKITTKTTKNGRTVETGLMHQGLFGGAYETAKRWDGSTVHRSYKSGLLRDYTVTDVRGDCHPCNGTGEFIRSCRACSGEGQIVHPGTPCKNCSETGVLTDGRTCPGCGGDGYWVKAFCGACGSCSGTGEYRESCRKCGGSGKFHKHSRS